MPDGTPAPTVLTESELVTLLRLDADGRDPAKAVGTLRRYREQGLLRGCLIGQHMRYPLSEALRFLETRISHDNGKRRL